MQELPEGGLHTKAHLARYIVQTYASMDVTPAVFIDCMLAVQHDSDVKRKKDKNSAKLAWGMQPTSVLSNRPTGTGPRSTRKNKRQEVRGRRGKIFKCLVSSLAIVRLVHFDFCSLPLPASPPASSRPSRLPSSFSRRGLTRPGYDVWSRAFHSQQQVECTIHCGLRRCHQELCGVTWGGRGCRFLGRRRRFGEGDSEECTSCEGGCSG